MNIIESILYIEFADFKAAGWKEDAIKKANLRNGPHWQMIPDPLDRRRVLVKYDALRKKDQGKLQAHFGNPYEYIAKLPIRKLVESDPEAEAFYRAYRYDSDKYLPLDHIIKYSKAAAWLNMLIQVTSNKRIIKKELNITLEKFWDSVCDLIKSDDIDLPSSYRRLIGRIHEYKDHGYGVLIHKHFGNKIAAKIGKTEAGFDAELMSMQVAVIRAAASRPNNFDAGQITQAVNVLFDKKGWPEVSRETVYRIAKQQMHLTMPGRRGKRDYNSLVAMQRLRKRPDAPLKFITLDGWTAELLFRENKTYNNRLTIVIVLDTLNNYPIGFAIGDRENTDLIKDALRNAVIHIRELLGDYYQPRQVQSDNYGIKTLTPFYNAIAHLHTPAAVGNAKSKVIEPYFDYINTRYCQFMPNWSGHNVTSSKKNQPNVEYLDMVKANFPDKSGVIKQLESIMVQERALKVIDYMKAWEGRKEDYLITMSRMDMLIAFGNETGYTNNLTGRGLEVSIKGQRLIYDSFDPAFRAHMHLPWRVIYDEDATSILVINDENKRRFILDQKRAIPMDVESMSDEDREYHKEIGHFNKARREEIIETYANDNAVVNELVNSIPLNLNDYNEATLKLMFTNKGQQKEAIQDAKGLKKIQPKQLNANKKEVDQQQKDWAQIQQDYLNGKVDFDEYSD